MHQLICRFLKIDILVPLVEVPVILMGHFGRFYIH